MSHPSLLRCAYSCYRVQMKLLGEMVEGEGDTNQMEVSRSIQSTSYFLVETLLRVYTGK